MFAHSHPVTAAHQRPAPRASTVVLRLRVIARAHAPHRRPRHARRPQRTRDHTCAPRERRVRNEYRARGNGDGASVRDCEPPTTRGRIEQALRSVEVATSSSARRVWRGPITRRAFVRFCESNAMWEAHASRVCAYASTHSPRQRPAHRQCVHANHPRRTRGIVCEAAALRA
jgi:hypothetical protein